MNLKNYKKIPIIVAALIAVAAVATASDLGDRLDRELKGGWGVLEVEVYQKGNVHFQSFTRGKEDAPLEKRDETDRTGTRVYFKPDKQDKETPEYQVSMVLYENGVSGDMSLNYGGKISGGAI